jgi:Neuraminidase (sialidase)
VAEAAFQHKPALWADNAASSPYFGNVYVCYSDQHSSGQGHALSFFANVARSTDGGVNWSARSVLPAISNFEQGGHFACAVRTDSHGVVYVFFNHYAFGFPGNGSHTMVKSSDGGRTWTQPREIVAQNDACYAADYLAPFSCVMDGFLGVRIDVTSAPSVDIANGAPSGENATNEIVDVWGDGRFGFNKEAALLSYSTDGGDTWSDPKTVSLPGDRALFAAVAICPGRQSSLR